MRIAEGLTCRIRTTPAEGRTTPKLITSYFYVVWLAKYHPHNFVTDHFMSFIELQRLRNVFFGSPSIRWWLLYRWVCGMYKNEKPRCKECKATDFRCEICKCRSSEQEKQANIKILWAFYFDHAACSKNWIFIRKLFPGVLTAMLSALKVK